MSVVQRKAIQQLMCVKASKLLIIFDKVIPHPRKTSVIITLVRTKAQTAIHSMVQSSQRASVLQKSLGGQIPGEQRTPRAADQGSSSPVESAAGNLEACALLPSSGSQVTAPSRGGKMSQSSNLGQRCLSLEACL